MEFIFNASSLTAPTFETLESYTKKRFAKLKRFLPQNNNTKHTVKVSVEKERHNFVLTAEVIHTERVLVKTQSDDIRKAIDMAADQLKRNLRRLNDKKHDWSLVRRKIDKYKDKFISKLNRKDDFSD